MIRSVRLAQCIFDVRYFNGLWFDCDALGKASGPLCFLILDSSALYLILPFLGAWAFALSGVYFKRAFQEGAKVQRAMILANVSLGLVFLPLLLLEKKPIDWSNWHQPLITGTLFMIGQLTSFIALRVGDVSLVTPVLGSKLIFVAVLDATLAGTGWRMPVVVASLLTTVGVALVGLPGIKHPKKALLTTLLTLGCAFSFACCDISVQKWSEGFGLWNFIPLIFVVLGAESILLRWIKLPGVESKQVIAGHPGPWLTGAVLFTGIQSILVTTAIALLHDATRVNVVYSIRGLLASCWWWCLGEKWVCTKARVSTCAIG